MGARVRFFDGAWYVFINHKGRRKAKKIGVGPQGQRAAEEAARKIEARLVLDDLGFVQDDQPVTFGAYSTEWLEGYVTTNLKASSKRQYRNILRHHWLPALGAVAIQDITRAQIRAIITKKLRDGMTHQHAEGLLNILQSCLAIAQEEGVITVNPVRGHGKWLLKAKATKYQKRRPKHFDESDLKAILCWFERDQPRWHALTMLLARTGMCIGEACALRQEDFDFEAREIRVSRTWGSGLRSEQQQHFTTPKTGERRVDMSLQLRDVLHAHMATYPPIEGWVFGYPERRTPIHPRYFHYYVWRPMFGHYGELLTYRPTLPSDIPMRAC